MHAPHWTIGPVSFATGTFVLPLPLSLFITLSLHHPLSLPLSLSLSLSLSLVIILSSYFLFYLQSVASFVIFFSVQLTFFSPKNPNHFNHAPMAALFGGTSSNFPPSWVSSLLPFPHFTYFCVGLLLASKFLFPCFIYVCIDAFHLKLKIVLLFFVSTRIRRTVSISVELRVNCLKDRRTDRKTSMGRQIRI